MTFKHKLSKRLAMMRDATVVLSALAMLACAGDQPINGPQLDLTSSSDILFQETFEDNAFAARGWYDNTGLVTTAAQHLGSGTGALELRFPAGATTPTSGGAARHLFQPTPTLYVSYWVKYSSNWVGSGRPYHPHEFLVLSDQDGDYSGLSNGWLVTYIEHIYQNGGIPRLAVQDNKAINTSYGAPPINLVAVTENRSTSGCNGVVEVGMSNECYSALSWYNDKKLDARQPYFLPTSGLGYKGDWNHVEVYLQLNSVIDGKGVADGVMQYWFNGTLVIDRRDILFRTGARPTIQFRQFVIAPYIGDGSPVDQTMWVDDLTLATGRIGSAPPPPPGASVASISVSPSTASVAAGGTSQLSATLKDASGDVLTGQTVTWASSDAGVATVSGSGLVSGVAAGSATISATSGGVQGTASVSVTAPVSNPGTVTDLAVAGVTDSSVTLSFTEVNNGAGQPASYVIRWAAGTLAWGLAADVALGGCKVPLVGTAIGAKRTCRVQGLAASTGYQFQLVAFRGTLNVDAVFGGTSNVASGTTAAPPAPVASVTLSPANASLLVGATQQLTATLKDAAGNTLSGRTITWASSAPAVATVSGSGLVTALAADSATITATSEGVQGLASVAITAGATTPGTVTDLAVTGVTDSSVTLSFTQVNNGAGQPASYVVRLAAGTLVWGSAADVALGGCKVPLVGTTIGAKRTCRVQGLAASTDYQFQLVAFRGTLNVDAVFGDISNVASGTTAAPPAPVASVTVNPANASLLVGATQQLTATLKDAAGNTLSGRAVTWTSSNPAVAAVSSPLVTAVATGMATITATSEGVQGLASVAITAGDTKPGTVTDLAVAGVTDSSVTLSFTEVEDGNGQPASYFVRFAVAPLAWASATDIVQGGCRVPMTGITIGIKRTCTVQGLTASTGYQFQLVTFRGTLNVDAVFGGLSNVASGTTAAAAAPVASVASVTLSPANASLLVGATQQFTATLKDAAGNTLSGRTITWVSNAPAVATVSAGGLVAALAAGSAMITATSEGVQGAASVAITTGGGKPGTVTDLAVVSASDSSVTLSFTEVGDGNGLPASYFVRFAMAPLAWASAMDVAQGSCRVPMAGSMIGIKRTCTVQGLTAGVGYQFQLVTFRGTLNVDAVFGGLSNVVPVAITAGATKPGTVTDLAVVGASDSSVTLSFTEVGGGNGLPASYFVRFAVAPLAWTSAIDVAQGSCRVPMAGSTIGIKRTCTVQGLAAGVGYQFQLVTFRGTLNVDAVFGGLSNVASGMTTASSAPVASVTVNPVSPSLTVGGTQLFTATLKDAAGNTLSGRAVTWTSSNPAVATVSSPLVTAVAIGTATITASSEGQSGAATVTVSLLPPPPPAPSGLWPHEPSGFTVIEETGWESGTLGNWYKLFESADKPITVEPITDSPSGESRALQIGYPAGHRGGGGTELRYRPPVVQYRELYVGYYVQVSAQWQGHSSGVNKMLYLHDGGGSFAAMWYEIFGSGSNPLDLYVVNQSGGSPSSMRENVNQITFQRGRWHKVEIYQKQGSPGIMRVWVDGVLAVDRSDVYTSSTPVDNITISGIWGGVGEYKDHFDYMRFDHIRISGR